MKKKIIYATTIMSTIALLSTGFAAWIISGNSTEDRNGNIAVDTVQDARRLITEFKWTDSTFNTALTFTDENQQSPKIVFGGKEAPSGAWLTGGVANGEESLKLYATFEVSNSETTGETSTFVGFSSVFSSITITSGENDTKYSTAVSNGLVDELPTITFASGTETTATGAPTAATNRDTKIEIKYVGSNKYQLSIILDWGSEFEYQNPIDYYNASGKSSATHGTEALANLEALEALNGASYKLSIVTKA